MQPITFGSHETERLVELVSNRVLDKPQEMLDPTITAFNNLDNSFRDILMPKEGADNFLMYNDGDFKSYLNYLKDKRDKLYDKNFLTRLAKQ